MFALAQDFEACVGCGFIRWWCHLGGGFYRGQRCGSGELICFDWVGRGFAGGCVGLAQTTLTHSRIMSQIMMVSAQRSR